MLLITQPSLSGITAQAENASTTETSGAMTNTPLLALAGMTGSLKMNFKKSAHRLQNAPGSDHVRSAPQLYRAPDLALEVDQNMRLTEEQADEQQEALEHMPQQRAGVALVHPFAGLRHGAASDQKP